MDLIPYTYQTVVFRCVTCCFCE